MLFRVAAFAALGGFLYGYDLGLIGGALLEIRDEFHASRGAQELVVGAAKFGAFFGTFLGGGLMLYYGRRLSIVFDSFFFMLGPIVMAASNSIMGLVVGRLLIGLGIGISAVVVPAYLGELAPAQMRGRIVVVYEVMLCAGMLSAALVDVVLAHVPGTWRWMVGVPFLPAFIMSAALLVLPESPRWLVVSGQLDEALAVIHRMYTREQLPEGSQASTAEVEQELLELWSSVQKDTAVVAQRRKEARARRGRGWRGFGERRWETLREEEAHPAQAGRFAGSGAGGGRGSPAEPHCVLELQAMTPAQKESQGKDKVGQGSAEQVGAAANGAASVPVLASAASSDGAPATLVAVESYDELPVENGSPSVDCNVRPLSPKEAPGLYRALSEIPAGLPRIRTMSEEMEIGEGGGESGLALGNPAGKGRQEAFKQGEEASTLPRPGSGKGFWGVLVDMLEDIRVVLGGPESRAARLALWLAVLNQACASTAVINYAPAMLERQGVDSYQRATLMTSAISGAKMCGVILSLLLIDSAGRRPLLVGGSFVGAGALLLMGAADHAGSPGLLTLACCLFILAFSASWAGVFWVVVSEIFTMASKSPAASAATAVLFLTGAAADLLFLTLQHTMGPFAFVMFAGVSAAGGVYVLRQLPETKGRTLAEVRALLAPGGEARQQELPQVQSPQPGRSSLFGAQHEGSSLESGGLTGPGPPNRASRWKRFRRQWAGYGEFADR